MKNIQKLNNSFISLLIHTDGAKRKLIDVVKSVRKDESGAALLEYTVLLGIILVAAVAALLFAGGWVSNTWNKLSSALPSY